MKSLILAWATAIGLLGLLIWWKNSRSYQEKSRWWRGRKTVVDLILVCTAAAWLPPLLLTWCVLWLVRPIKHPTLKATIGVMAGAFGGILIAVGTGFLEVLVLVGAFAVDLVTGRQGFLRHWHDYDKEPKERAA